jgi:hypothetical protein
MKGMDTRESQLAHQQNHSRREYWLKMCPKCHGDLYLDEAWFGRSLTCLQCGRSLSQTQVTALGGLNSGSHTPAERIRA